MVGLCVHCFKVAVPGVTVSRAVRACTGFQLGPQVRIELQLAREFVQIHPLHRTLHIGDQYAGEIHLCGKFRCGRRARDIRRIERAAQLLIQPVAQFGIVGDPGTPYLRCYGACSSGPSVLGSLSTGKDSRPSFRRPPALPSLCILFHLEKQLPSDPRRHAAGNAAILWRL